MAFFSLRALSRTPAKIDPEKLVKVGTIDLPVGRGHRQDRAGHQGGDQVQGLAESSKSCRSTSATVVHQGQVICELDQNDLLPRLRQAQAALDVAEAALKSAKADYERNKVDAAGPDVPFLKRDMERARTLFAREADRARTRATKPRRTIRWREPAADRRWRIWAWRKPPSPRPRRSSSRRRRVLAQSEEDLRNATIVSPIDGVVLSRDREVGDAVSSILTMGSGATLIMTLGDLREVYVKGKVDESDIGKVYLGQPARITVESFKDQNFSGKVTKISPMGVEKDNVTTFEVRVSISNEIAQAARAR